VPREKVLDFSVPTPATPLHSAPIPTRRTGDKVPTAIVIYDYGRDHGGTVSLRVQADFGGLFGELLCLSHKETCVDADGNIVTLQNGMTLTAFDDDADDKGNRDDLIASGIVEPSPETLRCLGSRWVLRIDRNGVRHESDLKTGS
jgi:hypothetical protein